MCSLCLMCVVSCYQMLQRVGLLYESVLKRRESNFSIVLVYCHVSVDEVTQEDYLLPWHNPAGNKGETFALKKKIVDIHEHMTRYIEELPVLIQEMVSTVLFFKKKINTLEDRINTVNNEAIKNQENHGLVMLLLESKEFYTDLLLEATDVFECIDTDIEIVVDFEEGEVQPGGEESNSEEDASSSEEEEDCDDIGIEYV
ncbi:uncharacterized protein LOC135492771 [Lineus longissimus]|uniref:uncharacterized protein LOC135492771 n=2 Tax=Lineus longissimus TaxID=88925 RepID=UPI00315D299F